MSVSEAGRIILMGTHWAVNCGYKKKLEGFNVHISFNRYLAYFKLLHYLDNTEPGLTLIS